MLLSDDASTRLSFAVALRLRALSVSPAPIASSFTVNGPMLTFAVAGPVPLSSTDVKLNPVHPAGRGCRLAKDGPLISIFVPDPAPSNPSPVAPLLHAASL